MTDFKASFRIIIVNLSFALFAGFVMFISFNLGADAGVKKFFVIFLFAIYITAMYGVAIFIIGRPKRLIVGSSYNIDKHFKDSLEGHYIIENGLIYFSPLIKAVGEVNIEKLLNPGSKFKVVGQDGKCIYIKEI